MQIDLSKYDLVKIKTVVPGTEEHVYDIEVDSDDHAFLAKSPSGAIGISHNSALISLSDLSDDRMRGAKFGDWWKENVQRALANNSFVIKDEIDVGIFMKEWLSLYESRSGERGIFSRTAGRAQAEKFGRRNPDHDWGCNPCSEILLRSRQLCNLSEVVIRETDDIAQLERKVRIATILGTFQSTLTNFKYVSRKWKENCEEERLLGVSLTGILYNELFNKNSPLYSFEASRILSDLREVAVETNKIWADKIGIPQSTAITCTKPSGCVDADTKIKTSEGVLSISEIFDHMGYDISSYDQGTWLPPTSEIFVYDENNEQKLVTNLFINGFSEVYEIEDEGGNTYRFTAEHKVKTGRGWVRVDQLTEGEDILSY